MSLNWHRFIIGLLTPFCILSKRTFDSDLLDLRRRQMRNYLATEAVFKNAGFYNITCIPLHDCKLKMEVNKENRIVSVYINNINYNPLMKNLPKMPKDSKITITYHSY